MHRLDMLLALIAVRHKGIVTREMAVFAGISERAIDERIAAGVLIPLFPGVYRHAAVPFTRESRWLAAVYAGGPGALLSRRAAAVHHGVDGIRRVRPDVTVLHGRLPVLAGVDWHRARTLGPPDRVVRGGIPVTSVARTLLDLCGIPWLTYETVEHAAQHAVITGKVTVEELFAVLDRVGGKGFEGTVRFRSVLQGGLPDATIQSMLELLLDRIVAGAAIPPGIRQYELVCTDGRRVVLDRAWPDLGVAIEADGLRWHATAAQVRAGRARSRSIQRSGYLHHSYGWTECHDTPLETRAEIEETILTRLRQAA
jgi:hypothetical protein